MKKALIDYEINAENPTGQIRILAADKIRMEAYARRNGWQLEDGPRTAACTVWAALTRTKAIEEMDFDNFIENILIDFAPAESNTENPTQ